MAVFKRREVRGTTAPWLIPKNSLVASVLSSYLLNMVKKQNKILPFSRNRPWLQHKNRKALPPVSNLMPFSTTWLFYFFKVVAYVLSRVLTHLPVFCFVLFFCFLFFFHYLHHIFLLSNITNIINFITLIL